jgi:hypothetical protein
MRTLEVATLDFLILRSGPMAASRRMGNKRRFAPSSRQIEERVPVSSNERLFLCAAPALEASFIGDHLVKPFERL